MKHILCILAALLFSQSILAQWETFKRRPCGTAKKHLISWKSLMFKEKKFIFAKEIVKR